MDLITTNFKKVQKVYFNLGIKKGTILTDAESYYEFCILNPDQLQRNSVEYEMTQEEESLGLIKIEAIEFFGGDNKPLILLDSLQDVKKEMQKNISMPIDLELKVSYLKDIIHFYSDIEGRIKDNENGQYHYEGIQFVDLTIEDFNKLDKIIYSDTLEKFKDNLRTEIQYLNKTILSLEKELAVKEFMGNEKITVNYQNENKKREPKNYPTKSFKLNRDLLSKGQNEHEILKEFHKALFSYGFIDNISYPDFSHSFTGRTITKQIRWRGSPSELYYLMKTIHDNNLIVTFKNYWDITLKVFLAYRKKTIPCTARYLQRCKPPTRNEQLKKLKTVISTLK